MKNFKRILSLLLAVVMTLGAAVIAGAADVSFTDVANHWAWTGGQIPYLVSKNVLNGYKQADGKLATARFVFRVHITNVDYGAELASIDYADPTGISEVRNEKSVGGGAVYDLQGRRVDSPARRSVLIVNGKKTL